jgi:hypothetical protein
MLPFRVNLRPRGAELAKYLSSINLSSRSQWDFELRKSPRPTGKANGRDYSREYRGVRFVVIVIKEHGKWMIAGSALVPIQSP